MTAVYVAAEKASAVILADAGRTAEASSAPFRPDLRHVLAHVPHPRKPNRTAVLRPSEVQETR